MGSLEHRVCSVRIVSDACEHLQSPLSPPLSLSASCTAAPASALFAAARFPYIVPRLVGLVCSTKSPYSVLILMNLVQAAILAKPASFVLRLTTCFVLWLITCGLQAAGMECSRGPVRPCLLQRISTGSAQKRATCSARAFFPQKAHSAVRDW